MRADIKRRISKSKQSIQQQKSGHRGISHHIPREGAAQCVLLGPPNSGKSSIVARYTNANPTVGDYLYTTHTPKPGMLTYENITFQLIDMPPISVEYMESFVPSLARVGNLILLVVALDEPELLDIVIERLKDSKLELVPHIRDSDYNASVVRMPTVILANKCDVDEANLQLDLLRETYSDLPILPISTFRDTHAAVIGRTIYENLDFIRIYTKAPGKQPIMDQPVIMQRGDTLIKAAQDIHKDFANNLKFARVWGGKTFDGQRVQRDYELCEGDIVEFNI